MNKQPILSELRFCEPMSRHTTFKIGGPVDIWAQPQDLASLGQILGLCQEEHIKVFAVGNGSNLLIGDEAIKACFINLNAENFKQLDIRGDTVTAGSGLAVPALLNALAGQGLSGMEFLAGVPASVGGALVSNAGGSYSCRPSGAYSGGPSGARKEIADLVVEAAVMNKNGEIFTLSKKDIIFRYRGCSLEKFIVLKVKMRLARSAKGKVLGGIKGYLKQKSINQELGLPSAGCIFKNPQGDSAGRLIDASGLKGARVGDAVVSHKHANFIINTGRAACRDVLALMGIIRKKVKKDHGVLLESEIKILG